MSLACVSVKLLLISYTNISEVWLMYSILFVSFLIPFIIKSFSNYILTIGGCYSRQRHARLFMAGSAARGCFYGRERLARGLGAI